MLFEQKIKYLDLYEAGEKVRGAGFIRMECWGDVCKIVVQVAGLFETEGGRQPILITWGEKALEIGEILLEKGKGKAEVRNLFCDDLSEGKWGDLKLAVTEAETLVIPLEGGRKLIATLKERISVKNSFSKTEGSTSEESERREREVMTEEQRKEKKGTEERSGERKGTEERSGERKGAEEEQLEKGKESVENEGETDASVGTTKMDVKAASEENGGERKAGERAEGWHYAMEATLKPGKWEQLGAIYPVISPFGDARSYLQISPGDFVILKDRSYRMVNNSFLLHGYFTYKHLILHRLRRNGEAIYYVGVPGSYYDKEKEVAILFGFESFEGAKEPAREGDFGYYMMRVEL